MADKKIFLARAYNTRQDLEDVIKLLAGTNIELNKGAGHQIEGTRAELQRLKLSDLTTVYGISVVITDEPTEDRLKEKAGKEKLYKNGN